MIEHRTKSEIVPQVGDYVRFRWGSPSERDRIFVVASLGVCRIYGGKLEPAALDAAGKAYGVSRLEVVGRPCQGKKL